MVVRTTEGNRTVVILQAGRVRLTSGAGASLFAETVHHAAGQAVECRHVVTDRVVCTGTGQTCLRAAVVISEDAHVTLGRIDCCAAVDARVCEVSLTTNVDRTECAGQADCRCTTEQVGLVLFLAIQCTGVSVEAGFQDEVGFQTAAQIFSTLEAQTRTGHAARCQSEQFVVDCAAA